MTQPICYHTILESQDSIILEDNVLLIQRNSNEGFTPLEEFQESEAIQLIKDYIQKYNFKELAIHLPSFEEGDYILIGFFIEKEMENHDITITLTCEESEEEIKFF